MLVLVAAGLVADRDAHRPRGRLAQRAARTQALDLDLARRARARVRASLLTGMLGLQPQPTVGEVARLPALRDPDAASTSSWPQRLGRARSAAERRAPAAQRGVSTLSASLAALAAACAAGGAAARRLVERRRLAPARERSPSRSPTRAATPAALEARRRARPRSRSRTTAPTKVTEFEVLDGRRDPRRGARTSPPGLDGELLAHARRRARTRRYCPGGDDAERGTLDRRPARAGRDRRAPQPTRRSPATARYVEAQTGAAGGARPSAFAAAVKAGDVAEAKALYAAARIPTSGSSRSPRASATSTRRSTRARTTSPADAVDRLPPDREGALGRRARPAGIGDARRQAAGRRQARCRRRSGDVELEPAQIANGAGRAARRGVAVEDHRRGGALLAHRPGRLPGQRRRRRRRRSTLLAPVAGASATPSSRPRSSSASTTSHARSTPYRRGRRLRLLHRR